MDKTAAVLSAERSSIFGVIAANYSNVIYYSIFDSGYSAPPACTISELRVNVVFSGSNSLGFAYIVISENPSTLVPVGSEIQENPPSFSTLSGPYWAGYEIYANSGATSNVWSAQANYNELQASYPPSGCIYNYPCAVASWVGLADEKGASPDQHLAQDGIFASCSGSGCTASYSEWYEMLPAPEVNCGGTNIHAGDSISEYTSNDVTYGGSNTVYSFYVADETTGAYCLSDGNSYPALSSPTRGEFIVEDPQCGSTSPCSLAQFSTVKFFDSQIYTSGQLYYIDKFSSSGYDNQFIMKNAPVVRNNICGTYITNAQPGTISNPGTFSAQWVSSDFTPDYPRVNC